MSRSIVFWISLLAAAQGAGCAGEQYRYVPAEHQANQGGKAGTEAIYSVPKGNPSGRVRVSTLGTDNNRLHLQLSISNQGKTGTWVLNPGEQVVTFPNQGPVSALNVFGKGAEPIEIRAGELRTLDLYFPLPAGRASADRIPEFDVHWKVHAGPEVVQEVTPFDRVEIARAAGPGYLSYPYYGYPGGSGVALGMGSYWAGY